METILVTGGAGFIGSNLIENLIKENKNILCLDNFFSSSENNINKFKKNDNFKLINIDITKHLKIKDKIDGIFNLACPASPVHYQSNPVMTINTNVIGSINMLELAKENNCKILQASTSEIYGDPLEHPQNEMYWGNVNPIGIRSCYDEGKRCAETLFFDYYRQYNLNIKMIRIFNTFGPGMQVNDGRVVSNFIVQALQGKDLTVFGDGSQTRSLLYIDDLVRGINLMFNTRNDFTGPVNLGSHNEISMIKLAEKIISLSNSKSKIIYKTLPADDPRKRKPDINLAKKELDWFPVIDLDYGLEKTINYFKKILKI